MTHDFLAKPRTMSRPCENKREHQGISRSSESVTNWTIYLDESHIPKAIHIYTKSLLPNRSPPFQHTQRRERAALPTARPKSWASRLHAAAEIAAQVFQATRQADQGPGVLRSQRRSRGLRIHQKSDRAGQTRANTDLINPGFLAS